MATDGKVIAWISGEDDGKNFAIAGPLQEAFVAQRNTSGSGNGNGTGNRRRRNRRKRQK